MINVGIAGIGFMGLVHTLSYAKARGIQVTAFCEQNEKRLAGDWTDIQGNFGPAGEMMEMSKYDCYTDFDEMLTDPKIDLIDITLPPALHADFAVKALKAGKHVFCEKPMALSQKDCKRMVAAAEKSGKQLFIGHVLPFFPEYAWALKQIQSGKYGKLLGGAFRRVISEPTWLKNFWSAEHVGGAMLDLHIHDAHFIRLLFGMPTSVTSSGRTKNGLAKYWNTQFNFADDYTVSATSGTLDQQGRGFNHGFEIHLEKGTLLFEFAVFGEDARYLLEPTVLDSRGKAKPAKMSDADPMDAFLAEVKEIAKCIKADVPSDILGAELARDAITICQKQTDSLLKGRTVKV